MPSTRTRDELWTRVIGTFSAQPDIYRIYTFGRAAAGKTDAYSDLDLIFCSADPHETQRKYRALLDSISPVVGSFTIVSTEHKLAEMVMLRGFSPYQKIDMSIVGSLDCDVPFNPVRVVYDSGDTPRGATSVLRSAALTTTFRTGCTTYSSLSPGSPSACSAKTATCTAAG